jgi:hypothetical protein
MYPAYVAHDRHGPRPRGRRDCRSPYSLVPLEIGAIRVGVLLAQRDAPGSMDSGVLTDLLFFAGAATEALLGSVPGGSEPLRLFGRRPDTGPRSTRPPG